MTWAVSVEFYPDSSDVGNVTAIWTEPTGTPPRVFTYPRAVKADIAGRNAFCAAAIAARNAWQTKNTENDAAAASALSRLNATDPQAV